MEEENMPPPPQEQLPQVTGEKRKREDDSPSAATEDAPPAVDAATATGDGVRHPMWKTSLCSYSRLREATAEGCNHGESCRYTHTEEELQPWLDGTWDPASERAKRLRRDAKEEAEEEVTVDDKSHLPAAGTDDWIGPAKGWKGWDRRRWDEPYN